MEHMQLQNPEFLFLCEEWQTVTKDATALSEEIKGSVGFEEGTLQAISDECKAVQGLDLSLKVSASMRGRDGVMTRDQRRESG